MRLCRYAHGAEAMTIDEIRIIWCMTQTTYRILPQSVILYGVEMTELDQGPRVLLTCSTGAAADTWISEIKRLSAAKFGSAGSPLRILPA